MKNNYVSLIAVLAIISSCTEEINPLDNIRTVTFRSSQELYSDTQTKTEYGDPTLDDPKVYWSHGDAISVSEGLNNKKGTMATVIAEGEAAENADFSASITDSETYYGLYPYDETAEFDGNTVETKLKAAQTALTGNLPQNTNLAVAVSSTTDMSFKNVGAIARFSFTDTETYKAADVESVVFSGNNGEIIAGEGTVTITDTPTIAFTTGSETVTLSGSFESGANYFLVFAPETFSNGFTFKINMKDGTVLECASSKEKAFERSKLYRFGELFSKASVVKEVYKQVESTDELETGKYLLVYPNGDNTFKVFSFDNAAQNAIDIAAEYKNVGGLSELKKNARAIYSSLIENDYVTLSGDEDGYIDPTAVEEGNLAVSVTYTSTLKEVKYFESTLTSTKSTYRGVISIKANSISASFNENGTVQLTGYADYESSLALAKNLRNSDFPNYTKYIELYENHNLANIIKYGTSYVPAKNGFGLAIMDAVTLVETIRGIATSEEYTEYAGIITESRIQTGIEGLNGVNNDYSGALNADGVYVLANDFSNVYLYKLQEVKVAAN